MKEIISKELLSAILKRDVTRVGKLQGEIGLDLPVDLHIQVDNANTWVNIDSIARMAKEWALKPVSGRTGYIIHIEPIVTTDNGIMYVGHAEDMSCFTIFDGDGETFTPAYTTDEILNKRYKATFQACQWVYDNKVKGESND